MLAYLELFLSSMDGEQCRTAGKRNRNLERMWTPKREILGTEDSRSAPFIQGEVHRASIGRLEVDVLSVSQ